MTLEMKKSVRLPRLSRPQKQSPESAVIIEGLREELRVAVYRRLPSTLRTDEVEAHFRYMPDRYWVRVNENDLLRHLEIIHSYCERVGDEEAEVRTPIIRWKHFAPRGYSEAIVCASNQHGLLAKVAGAFAAASANVLDADIYTRRDHLVLNIFHVCDPDHRPLSSAEAIHEMEHALAASLGKHGDLPFTHVAAGARTASSRKKGKIATTVTVDNDVATDHTVLQIRTVDYLGLLHDVLQVLSLCDVEIDQAKIHTRKDVAEDVFYITGLDGRKIASPARLDLIRKQLLEMIQHGTMLARSVV